jgi:hypothetical protein
LCPACVSRTRTSEAVCVSAGQRAGLVLSLTIGQWTPLGLALLFKTRVAYRTHTPDRGKARPSDEYRSESLHCDKGPGPDPPERTNPPHTVTKLQSKDPHRHGAQGIGHCATSYCCSAHHSLSVKIHRSIPPHRTWAISPTHRTQSRQVPQAAA